MSVALLRPARFCSLWLVAVLGAAAGGLPLLDVLLLPNPRASLVVWVHGMRERKVRQGQLSGPAPRLLIAGGSSSFFSLDAEVLEARLHRPVYNLGTNAGLGLRFLLDSAREAARPGDTILLYLEDSLYRKDPVPVEFLEHVIIWSGELPRLWRLPWRGLWQQLYEQPWSAYRSGWSRRNEVMLASRPADEEMIPYSCTELSPRGDFRGQIGAAGMTFVPWKPMAGEAVSPAAAQEMETFFAWCQKHGVKVIGTAPTVFPDPAPAQEVEREARALRDFYERHSQAFVQAGAVISLPKELMLDTPFHANAAGRRLISEAYAAELGRHFQVPPPPPGAPLLLVADRESTPAREMAFTAREISGCRYLSPQPIDHPLCLTAPAVAAARKDSTRFVFADPEARRLLAEAGLASTLTGQSKTSLAEWIRAYPTSIFALLTQGGERTESLAAGLPEPWHSFLLNPNPCKAALFGPGVRLSKTHRKFAEVQLAKRDQVQRGFRFPVSFVIRSFAPEAGRGGLLIDRTPNGAATPGNGLQVAVYDPESGLVVKSGFFTGPDLVESQQWEVN